MEASKSESKSPDESPKTLTIEAKSPDVESQKPTKIKHKNTVAGFSPTKFKQMKEDDQTLLSKGIVLF